MGVGLDSDEDRVEIRVCRDSAVALVLVESWADLTAYPASVVGERAES